MPHPPTPPTTCPSHRCRVPVAAVIALVLTLVACGSKTASTSDGTGRFSKRTPTTKKTIDYPPPTQTTLATTTTEAPDPGRSISWTQDSTDPQNPGTVSYTATAVDCPFEQTGATLWTFKLTATSCLQISGKVTVAPYRILPGAATTPSVIIAYGAGPASATPLSSSRDDWSCVKQLCGFTPKLDDPDWSDFAPADSAINWLPLGAHWTYGTEDSVQGSDGEPLAPELVVYHVESVDGSSVNSRVIVDQTLPHLRFTNAGIHWSGGPYLHRGVAAGDVLVSEATSQPLQPGSRTGGVFRSSAGIATGLVLTLTNLTSRPSVSPRSP